MGAGSRIELRDYVHEFADYLDNQRLHSGDHIELLHIGKWKRVRYQIIDHTQRHVLLIFDDDEAIWLNREVMAFRWPRKGLFGR